MSNWWGNSTEGATRAIWVETSLHKHLRFAVVEYWSCPERSRSVDCEVIAVQLPVYAPTSSPNVPKFECQLHVEWTSSAWILPSEKESLFTLSIFNDIPALIQSLVNDLQITMTERIGESPSCRISTQTVDHSPSFFLIDTFMMQNSENFMRNWKGLPKDSAYVTGCNTAMHLGTGGDW